MTERLWAPWRLEYVGSADYATGCIFCDALAGDDEGVVEGDRAEDRLAAAEADRRGADVGRPRDLRAGAPAGGGERHQDERAGATGARTGAQKQKRGRGRPPAARR